AWIAVAILMWPGELLMYRWTSVFGFAARAMNALALTVWWIAGMKLFLSIVGPPAIPRGVKPFAGSWAVWVMYLMIADWSIANAIARRWFTSEMFLTLNP